MLKNIILNLICFKFGMYITSLVWRIGKTINWKTFIKKEEVRREIPLHKRQSLSNDRNNINYILSFFCDLKKSDFSIYARPDS